MTEHEGEASLLLDLIDGWVRRQRWFPAKDAAGATLRTVASIDLADPWQEAACTVVLLELRQGAAPPSLLQVPLVATSAWPADQGVITRLGTDEVLVDGPQHPAFVRAWLAAAEVRPGATISPEQLDAAGARVHPGEQSNTSVRVPGGDGRAGAQLKIFRVLAAGANPDIEVAAALREAGWAHVPDKVARAGRRPGAR